MEQDLARIQKRNGERRRYDQQVALDRREGERRRNASEDAMRALKASTARHKRTVAAIHLHREREITDWQARYYDACRAQGHMGIIR